MKVCYIAIRTQEVFMATAKSFIHIESKPQKIQKKPSSSRFSNRIIHRCICVSKSNVSEQNDYSALQEARKIARNPKIKGYTDVEEALRALKS